MADGTKIEWSEATWNPITGCSVVSPGCTNCYAMRLAGTRLCHHPTRKGLTRDTRAGPVWTGEVRLNASWLDQPLRWKRPRMIFVCAHGDLFHEAVPDEWIDRAFAVMACSSQHTFQLLTKRPERARRYLSDITACGPGLPTITRVAFAGDFVGAEIKPAWLRARWPLPNVWLGVSVEDQARADERIPILLDTPAAVRWISAEPLLGPVELNGCLPYPEHWRQTTPSRATLGLPCLDWVVIGGESGPGARDFDIAWARDLIRACKAGDVPVFMKQIGSNSRNGPYREWIQAYKGSDPDEWPEDLRVREWPHG